MSYTTTMEEFAYQIHLLLKSDRDVTLGCGGMTGEGKSTFFTQLGKKVSEASGVQFSFNNMTWSRKEKQ